MSSSEQPTGSRVAGVLRVLERLLFAGGTLLVLAYASACAHRELYQASQSQEFDRAVAEVVSSAVADAISVEDHDQREWSEQRVARFEASRELRVSALGRLEVPTGGISVMVLDGTDDTTLDRAVGRIEGTARLGERGNLGIAGHRDGFFRGLRHVRTGDEIRLVTLYGVNRYTVDETRIVSPKDVAVLEPTVRPALTLVTCYPFYYVGSAPQRYVVRAYETGFEPWTEQQLDALAAHSPAAPQP